MSFENNLRDAVKKSGLTHQQIADAMEVDRVAVGQWINGITQPRLAKLPALAQLLGVTPNDFFGIGLQAEEEKAVYQVSQRAKVIDDLLDSIPASEVDEVIRNLEEKKLRYDAFIEEILKKRRA